MSIFMMGTGATVRVTVTDQTAEAVGSSGAVEASYELQSDGDVYIYEAGTPTFIEYWAMPPSAANMEAKATVTSGSISSGTTGSWLALSTTRTWTVSRATVGISSATMTVEIRRIGTTLTLGSCSVTLTAEKV